MNTDKPITKWTRKELLSVPTLSELGLGQFDQIEVNGVVLIPTRRKHESGYSIIDMVFIRKGEAVARANGVCDVINTEMPVNMDCLPTSKCIYVWTRRTFVVDWPGSSSVTLKEKQA